MKLLVFGAGFSGRAIARHLVADGAQAWGTTRAEEKFDALGAEGMEPVLFEGEATDAVRAALRDATHIVQSIAPPRDGPQARETVPPPPDIVTDPVLEAFGAQPLSDLAPRLEWVGYLSTVGVYGDHGGAWVDEDTPAAPTSARSRQRVRAEAEWLAIAQATGLPVCVARLSGIYGPGRNALRKALAGEGRRLVKKDQVFNRIHVEDIAAALARFARERRDGIVNVTDDEPAPPQDVVLFAHDLVGREAPPPIDFETADLTPMARSFYGENKRVSNARSKDWGHEYRFPDYRAALTEMWERERY